MTDQNNFKKILEEVKTNLQHLKFDKTVMDNKIKELKLLSLDFSEMQTEIKSKNQIEEFQLTRDFQECLCLYKINQKKDDINSSLHALVPMYLNRSLQPSPNQHLFLALNLLSFITQNDYQGYSTQLGSMDYQCQSNDYVKVAVNIYNSLVKGSQADIHNLIKNPPHWSFAQFQERIGASIRFSITRGVESAQNTISKEDLATKLGIKDQNELKNLLNTDFNHRTKEWLNHNTHQEFKLISSADKQETDTIGANINNIMKTVVELDKVM